MTPTEILEAITAAGGELRCTGDGVSIITPEPLDPELLAQVRQRKAELLPLLQAEETGASQMCPLSCGQVGGGLADADTTPTVRTQAMTWLSTALASGPQPESKLALEAQAAGISKASLRRAKSTLGVQSKRDGKHWVWVSPQGAQDAQDAHGQGVQDAHGQGVHRQQANPKTIPKPDPRTGPSPLRRHHLGELPPPFDCLGCGRGDWREAIYHWACRHCQRIEMKL